MNTYDEVEILLVEDNPEDVEMSIRALKRNRITNNILAVSNGEEALDYLFKRGKFSNLETSCRPKVILLDIRLPRLDGKEVLRIIKNDPKTQTIPVIMLTSSKEERDIMESYQYGANSYIVKPVEFDKFTKSIQEIGMYWLLLNQHP
ncbi:MAG TPA: response regulator [Candidatus Aminicenantes bacterium]|nr:response regulator [Candidatus Aminicenantes bacterium]